MTDRIQLRRNMKRGMSGYSSDRGGNCDVGWAVRVGLLEEVIFQQRHEGWVGVI